VGFVSKLFFFSCEVATSIFFVIVSLLCDVVVPVLCDIVVSLPCGVIV
jgi:hypothetical protein